jgi:hypothetical protein
MTASGVTTGAGAVLGAGTGTTFSTGADGEAGLGVVESCAKAGRAISATSEAAVQSFFMIAASSFPKTLPGRSKFSGRPVLPVWATGMANDPVTMRFQSALRAFLRSCAAIFGNHARRGLRELHKNSAAREKNSSATYGTAS